jgi:Holliday junction resolvasome RuvABC ATP-dependent DNA helicase subunit
MNVGLALQEFLAGGPFRHMLVTGESGLGKTLFQDCIETSLKDAGVHVIRFACPTAIVGEEYASLCMQVRDIHPSVRIVIMIDEAHRMAAAGARRSVIRTGQFIQQVTDARMEGKTASVNDGELSAHVDSRKLGFVLGTNFAGKLEEAKGSTSFRGRFNQIALESYSRESIDQILERMITSKGLRVADSTRGYIAGTARGNARPLDMITGKLVTIASAKGNATLNRDDIMLAIRLSDLYPAGLAKHELAMVERMAMRPTRQNVLATMFPNIDTTSFRESLAYLQGKDFVAMASGGFQTTPIGARYLATIQGLGFKLPSTEGN